MSQHWHGHWTEDTFTPKRLGNWEVPKWYPSWPERHCVTTKFITNDNGHILCNNKKVIHSQWTSYKGTWDLPKRITRSIAEELSAAPQHKKNEWELHKKKYYNFCKKIPKVKKEKEKIILKDTVKKNKIEKI